MVGAKYQVFELNELHDEIFVALGTQYTFFWHSFLLV